MTRVPVTALPSHELLVFLMQLAVLLSLATVLGRVARRYGLPVVVGELLAGVVLGPSVLGHAIPSVSGWLLPARPDQMRLLEAFSQFAVVLLVGVTGLQVDVRALWRRRRTLGTVSATSLSAPFVLGVAGGAVVPAVMVGHVPRTQFAVFLGVLLSLSSLPVIAKTLGDLGLLHREVGQLTMGSASLQDAVGWLLLSLSASVAVHGADPRHMAAIGVRLVAFLAVAATAGRLAVRAVLRTVERAAEPGLATATGVIVVVLGAAAAQAVGLEAVFGAFVAGVVVGSAGASALGDVGSLRSVTTSVLAPIFLATAGLHVDARALRGAPAVLTTLLVLALATTGKLAGGYAGGRMSRLGHWRSLALGGALNARGVVEIVAAAVGLRVGLLTPAMYTVVVLVALATSVMAGPLLVWATARGDAAAAAVSDDDAARSQPQLPAAARARRPTPTGTVHLSSSGVMRGDGER